MGHLLLTRWRSENSVRRPTGRVRGILTVCVHDEFPDTCGPWLICFLETASPPQLSKKAWAQIDAVSDQEQGHKKPRRAKQRDLPENLDL
jgi:hypothetical protein